MRITVPLTTAGKDGMAGFMSVPRMAHDGDYYFNEDRSLKEADARSELGRKTGITFESDDDSATIALTVDLLDRMRIAIERLMRNDDTVRIPEEGEQKTSAERRYDRGKVAFVRVDIRRNSSGIRIKVEANNPLNVPGNAEEFARVVAQAFLDNIVDISDGITAENQNAVITIVEGNGCAGLTAKARRRNKMFYEREKRKNCPNRVCGYCSPINKECCLYDSDGGKCMF